jgi:hypothetical protein
MPEQLDLFHELFCQPHSDTSRAAAQRYASEAPNARRRVFNLLEANPRGLTDEEMQTRLRMNGSTQRPRRIELECSGLVRDSGRRRKTRSGAHAAVWIVTGAAYPTPKTKGES